MVTLAITAEFADASHARFTFTTTPDLKVETVADDRDVYLLEMQDFLRAIETGGVTESPRAENHWEVKEGEMD